MKPQEFRKKPLPPHWPDKILERFCAPHLLEEVMGDLHERFYLRAEKVGVGKARRQYVREVLSYVRPYIFKREKSPYQKNLTNAMLKNYLKIAWRNIFINRLYSMLNISGLAVGLACGILILLRISLEFSFDTFHKNLPDTFVMMKNHDLSGTIHTGETTPAPLAAKLRDGFPEVKYVASTGGFGQHLINRDTESSYENGMYAEGDLFNILTFPTLMGDPVKALNDPSSFVITESTAKNWFGDENPMGKTIQFDNTDELQVGAVVQDVPSNSTFKFDMVLPFRLLEQKQKLKWDNNSFINFVALQSQTDLSLFNEKIKLLLTENLENEKVELFAYPLAKLHLYSRFRNGEPVGGNIEMVQILGCIGIFILLIACINFMNLATARSERRAREVGIRKVMGAYRRLIVGQFLSEALVMTFLGLALSIVLVNLVLPFFNQLVVKKLEFNFTNWQIWSSLLLIGLITGIVAGSYPAFYLSGFQPLRVLKGVVMQGRWAARLRKGLVTFQFIISIFLLITTIVIFNQLDYVLKRPLGYEQENLIEIPANGDLSKQFAVVKNDLLQIPGVTSVSAGTDNLLHMGGGLTDFAWPGKNPEEDFNLTVTWVQYDWVKTAGLHLLEGRDFSPDYGSDLSACLLNKTAVERMGLKDPIGTIVGDNNQVIGVVDDFVFNNPTSDPNPMVIFLRKEGLGHFFVRFQNDEDWQERIAQMETVIKKHNPTHPVNFHFTKEEYQIQFDEIRGIGNLTTTFSGLAIFIACLGLVGLSAYIAEQRRKEIGIRKVLGASVSQISFSLSQDFLKPVLWSFILAAPLAGWAMNELLKNMDYHISLAWWMFALAGIFAAVIALFTIGFQSIRAALANPVDSLRNE